VTWTDSGFKFLFKPLYDSQADPPSYRHKQTNKKGKKENQCNV